MYAHQSEVIQMAELHSNNIPWTEIPATKQQVQVYEAHEPLFCEWDDAGFVYEVLEGVVCCYRLCGDGRRQVLSFCYPGDLIGLVQGDFHRYSSEVLTPARIRRIPRSMLLKTAKERPELGQKLLRFATSELAVMQDHFALLGRKMAVEKVASFLLGIANRHISEGDTTVTFQLPMTRVDIADYLGLTLETVSRSMTKLKIAGAIDLPQSSTVVIRDIFRLEDLAEASDKAF